MRKSRRWDNVYYELYRPPHFILKVADGLLFYIHKIKDQKAPPEFPEVLSVILGILTLIKDMT